MVKNTEPIKYAVLSLTIGKRSLEAITEIDKFSDETDHNSIDGLCICLRPKIADNAYLSSCSS